MTPMPVAATPRPGPAPGTAVPAPGTVGPSPGTVVPAAPMEEVRDRAERKNVPEGGQGPQAKRSSLSVQHVVGEDLSHVDEEPNYTYVDEMEYDTDLFDDWSDELEQGDFKEEDMLWYPGSEEEPHVDSYELARLDEIADRHELQRLETMGVLSRGSNTDGQSFVCQIREDMEEKAQSPSR